MNTAELRATLRRRFGLDASEVSLVRSGLGRTWRVVTARSECYVRLALPNPYLGSTASDLEFESELQDGLHGAGLPVPELMKTTEGSPAARVDSGGVRYHMTVSTAMRGAPHAAWWPGIVDEDTVRGLGVLIAELHDRADRLRLAHHRYSLDLEHLWAKPVRLLTERLKGHGIRSDLSSFAPFLDSVRDSVLGLPRRGGAWGVLHGDLHVGNVLYDRTDGFALIDFGHCSYGWRMYDLIPFLDTLEMNVPERAVADAVRRLVVEGYCRSRRLSVAEREAVPALRVLWHLWDVGETLILSDVFGGPLKTAPDATPAAILHTILDGLRALRERYRSGALSVWFPPEDAGFV